VAALPAAASPEAVHHAVLIVSRTCSARIGFSRTELAPAFKASALASSLTIAKVKGRCAAFKSRAVFSRKAASG